MIYVQRVIAQEALASIVLVLVVVLVLEGIIPFGGREMTTADKLEQGSGNA